MIASAGRFGPYIRYDKNKFVSIPDDITPQEVTLDQAIELIEAKKEADARKVLKTFDEDPDMKRFSMAASAHISLPVAKLQAPQDYRV